MPKNKSKIYELDTIRFKKYTAESIKCKNCGHIMFFESDRKLCTFCGCWVYKNEKIEFKYKFNQISKKH